MRLLNEIADLFFPKSCPICGNTIKTSRTVCFECESKIPPLNRENKIGGKWYFDELFYRAAYDSMMGELIRAYKYGPHPSIGSLLTDLFVEMFETFPPLSNSMITVVPITFRSYKEKGFDHMYLIGKELSKKVEIPFLKLLDISKQTRSQVGSSNVERMSLVDGKYSVRYKDLYRTCGSIILIDDVFTTGSTVNECSKILKEAGAKNVCVYTLAKAKMLK
jgi:competence protein ComFC